MAWFFVHSSFQELNYKKEVGHYLQQGHSDMEFQLITAIREGNIEEVKAVLDENSPENTSFIFMGGATPLHW